MTPFVPGKRGVADYALDERVEVDVVVIGSGAGGTATAAALAERGKTVAVVEAGSHWQPSSFKHSATWAWRHLYDGRGTRATQGNAVMVLPGGRGVGGSTLINSAICFRTPDSVLASWRHDHGCTDFDQVWMNQCFDRIWQRLGVSVNPVEVQRDNNLIFKRGADALGLRGDWLARAAPACVGCGSCQQGCNIGAKQSGDRTFLADALATGLVTAMGDCRVEQVEEGGGVVVRGVTLDPTSDTPRGRFEVRAQHVVLAAGAVGTPRLLLENGLGQGPIGENLHVHPTAATLARFPHDIKPWTGVTQGYYVDQWEKGFLLQVFTAPPDQAWVSVPLPPSQAVQWMADLRRCAMAGAVVHDEDSVGQVTTGGLWYWLGDRDRRVLLEAMRTKARIYFAAGAEAVVTGIHGVAVIERPEDIDAAITDDIPAHQIGMYASHPMGTCRMGADSSLAVVAPSGRLHGHDHIWLADASVFPTSLGVNPQVTVYAIGLTVGRNVAMS